MVPLQLLISMFSDGVNSVKELANQRKSRANELAGNLAARRVIIATTVLVLFIRTLKILVSDSRLESNFIDTSLKCFLNPFHSAEILISFNKRTLSKTCLR